jgi:uncharacterized protein (DUF58 family)
MFERTTNWLETKWVTPAYAGWLLIALTICFFGAATNTMAGWLYVMSGVGVALLGVAAILPARSLQSLTIDRPPISPVTAGAELELALIVRNPTDRSQSLFQVQDLAPFSPAQPPITAVEQISPQSEYRWVYRQPTERRGVYQWDRIALRSGAPIGLFWCQRYRQAAAIAYVYPQVLKLSQCPLIDGMGSSERPTNRQFSSRHLEMANEGITRSLRPYRYGDPFRSIHWRTSARYGEFQVRELEIDRGGQDVVIYLDSAANWNETHFEQAVIAACSLYFYANQFAHLHVKLWTAGTGLVSGDRRVLETLAAVQMDEPSQTEMPQTSLVCLTSQPQQLENLPPGSSWALWASDEFTPPAKFPGIVINPQKSLQKQLSNASFNDNRHSNTPYIQSPITSPNPQLN